MRFFKRDEDKPWGTSYGIFFTMETLPASFNGVMPVALFGNTEERDKYFATFTEAEAERLITLTHELWMTSDVAEKRRISNKIEKLKNDVQKRAGIIDT